MGGSVPKAASPRLPPRPGINARATAETKSLLKEAQPGAGFIRLLRRVARALMPGRGGRHARSPLRHNPPAMPPLPPLGAHISVAGGMPTAIERATELGCTAIQVFVKNANQWRGREVGDEEAAAFRAAHAASRVGPLLAHASYLINLCAADPALLAR